MDKVKCIRPIIIVWIILMACNFLNADSRIVLYLKRVPSEIINQAVEEVKQEYIKKQSIKNTKSKPSKTAKKRIRGELRSLITPKLSGFLAIYAGYIDVSDPDGLISFPLRHTTPKIYVAITEEINLIKVKENTISHREFTPNVPTKIYSLERKEDVDPKDPNKKTLFLNVQEVPIPADKKINSLMLVIFTNPSNVYVPLGDFLASEGVHLVLPDIYVIGNKNQEGILLQSLDIRSYFEPINKEDKKEDKKAQSLIKNI